MIVEPAKIRQMHAIFWDYGMHAEKGEGTTGYGGKLILY